MMYFLLYLAVLRLPHRNDVKIAKICNFWTFWHVIQLIGYLFKISNQIEEIKIPISKKNPQKFQH